jgi:hypothetical protein
LGGEKVLDERLSLKLPHNLYPTGSLVMNLGSLHAALPIFVIEEVEYSVERLLGIIHHVSERPALTIPKEIVAGYAY